MKVILIANISANGQVLLAGNPAHEAPQEALGFFVQEANTKGNLIIGRKTFDVLQQFPGGLKAFFPNVEIVIVSQSTTSINGFTVVSSPENAIKYLSDKEFKEIIVGGGANIYNEFLEKDLVTDIYFNYIPVIIGDGGVIGIDADLNTKFAITSYKLLTDSIAQLHLTKA